VIPPRHPWHGGGVAIAIAIAIAVAGCGSGAGARAGAPGRVGPGPVVPKKPASAQTSSDLAGGWSALRLPSGAALPYPSSWRQVHGDPGTASAALFNANGTIRAYLNATPADSTESLHGWARFRLHHNADEGDRNVRLIAAHNDVSLAAGRASCVVDDYATSRSRYRELACIVAPSNGGHVTVLVAAAQPNAWAHEHLKLDYAIDHFIS
jgi:hypothetical protein